MELDGVGLQPVAPDDFYVPLVDLRKPGYGDQEDKVAEAVKGSVARQALTAQGLTGDMWVRSQPQADGFWHSLVIAGVRVDGFATLQMELSNRFHWVRPLPFACVTVLESQKTPDDSSELWGNVSKALGSLGLYCSSLFTQVFPLNPPRP